MEVSLAELSHLRRECVLVFRPRHFPTTCSTLVLVHAEDGSVRLLLVEDDVRIAKLLATYLERYGIEVVHCPTGTAAERLARKDTFDVVVLDIMLPGTDGLTVCRLIRDRSTIPIIMVTALGEEADRVSGLEIGADDYMVKPISARELLARIRALLRRVDNAKPPASILRFDSLELRPDALRATIDECNIDLTPYQFALLQALAARAGRILSRERLLDLTKGTADEAFDRSIDVQISRIRKKLGRYADRLRTVRGAGYLFSEE